ncbi:uncharacterized protein [Apostichopus japonicus]|uniref:uncharacterized protein isoform X2 n=1 Tax=Stichopus japonicus TaxID=307972 RepID=UPI003AB22041
MYRICEEEKRNWKYILINLEAVSQATAVKIQSQDSAECTSPSKVNVTHVEVQCSLVPHTTIEVADWTNRDKNTIKATRDISHSGDDGPSAAVASTSGYTEKPAGSPDYTPSVNSSEHDKDDASRLCMGTS